MVSGRLIVYEDDQTYFRLTRLYGSGNQFQFTKQIDTVREHVEVSDPIASTVSYLRIVKQSNTYSGYYSADGVVYTQVWTTQTADLADPKIGLIVCAGTGLVADFDYFRITKNGTNSPQPTAVTGVTLAPSELSVQVGETAVLSATVTPFDATNKAVTWSSDNLAVAQANPNGTVTAIGVGTAIITVTTADGSMTATSSVEVLPPPDPQVQNIAPLADLSASSSHENGNFPPQLAIDGIKNQDASRWITDTTLAGPHWLEMDWDTYYGIDRVKVWSGFKGLTNRQIADFEIQYWDGSGWQTAAAVTSNEQDGRFDQFNELTFPVVTTNKLRMYITKGSAYDSIARLFELEVWGLEQEISQVPVSTIAISSDSGAFTLRVNETLQMEAAVGPVNATEKSVTWSVVGEDEQPTDKASIDQNGLLTAYVVGTVKAVATANDGSGVSGESIVTIAPQPEPEGQNIAPLADLSVSSTNGNYTKEKATDGIKNQNVSRWISAPDTLDPQWIQLEWNTAYEISAVKIWSGFLSWMGSQIADFEIQYWDGSGWQTAVSITGNTEDIYYGDYNDLSFPTVTTDKLRLYITQGSVNDNMARLFELEVWGKEQEQEVSQIPVSAITVVGWENEASYITGNESLQLTAHVGPENATDQSVTWSVVDEDGATSDKASIDQTGLLTPHHDGIVKVVALANDGSGIISESNVSIDTTPPVIEMPTRLAFLQTESILQLLTATDNVSGLQSLEVTFNGQSSDNPLDLEALSLQMGEYPILVSATDRAGHRSVEEFTLSVVMDIDHLDELIAYGSNHGWVGNSGIENSLMAHVNNIQRDREDDEKVLNSIKAMENAVKAQKGKHIDEGFANILLEDLEGIK